MKARLGLWLSCAAIVVVGLEASGASAAHLGEAATKARAIAASVSSTAQPLPAPAGAPAYAGAEIPNLRTADSRTYLDKNGGFVREITAGPLNYKDSAGSWQPIDNSLVTSGSGYTNAANSYHVQLPSTLGAPVQISNGGRTVSISLVGAGGSASVAGSTATYAQALPGVTASYTAEGGALKEDLALAGPASASSFTYALAVPAGSLASADGGRVVVKDASGAVEFQLAAPSMHDAAGASSSSIRLSLTGASPNYTLTVVPDGTWLHAAARRWPVTVDPTWILVTDDTFIESGSPTSNFGYWDDLYVGQNGPGNIDRSLLWFDMSSLPAKAQIEYAELDLYQYSSAWCNCNESIDVDRLTRRFTFDGATWNTYDGANAWSTAGGDYDRTPVATKTVTPTVDWFTWQISDLVRRWYEGTTPNDGLLLRASDETNNTNLAEFDSYNNGTNVPAIWVAYQPRLGLRPMYTYESFPISDQIGASVNVGNGNMVVAAHDATFNGVAGLNLDLTHYYNSLAGNPNDAAGNVGQQWTFMPECFANYPADSSLYYDAPSGYEATFDDKGNGVWAGSEGMNATVSIDTGSSGFYWLTFNQSGEKAHCYANGITSIRDKNGNKFDYYLNNNDLLHIDDMARSQQDVSFTYNASDLLQQMSDHAGRTWQYAYNAAGDLTSTTNPLNDTYTYGYDANHRMTSITAPDGDTTAITYDSEGRVTTVQRGLNSAGTCPAGSSCPTTTFAYVTPLDSTCSGSTGAVGESTVTDPLNHVTTYCYDLRLRILKTVDPVGRSTTTSWNDNDDPASDTNTAGGTTDYTYSTDGLNNLKQVQGPANPGGLRQTDTLTYPDPNDPNTKHPFYPSAYGDANGHSWSFTYDDAGNQIEQADGNTAGQGKVDMHFNADGTTDWVRDASKNGNSSCPDTTVTLCYTYLADGSHDLQSIVYPSPLGTFHFTWDNLHRLHSITDGKNQTTTYAYDALDRLKTITYNDGSTVTYVYDSEGNLTSEADGTQTTTYSYDHLNRLVTETKPDQSTIAYDYDAAGRLAALTEKGATTRYGYDAADRLTSIQEPGVPAAIGIAYPDETHSTITYPGGATVASGYDTSGRLLSIVDKDGASATVASYTYGYVYTDAGGAQHDGGLRSSVTTVSGTTAYGYDFDGRLALANGPDGLFQYAYDANGNMCTKRIATAGTAPDAAFACGSSDTGTTSYSFNPANELSPAPTYQFDANGNQTAMPAEAGRAGLSFAYDVREQTSSITPSGQSALAATYFGPGQFRRTGFGGDSFFEDSLGVGRWTSGSTVTDFTRNPGGTELSESVGGTRYYFAFDGLGSVVGLFSSSGSLVSGYVARYEPYGKLINATPAGYPALPIRFAGYWFDSQTGLYKVGARYYDPVAGRWTQRDPMDNPYDLHGWNRYIYAGDDPINMTDPSGALPVISQRQVRMICRRYPSECRGHNINWRKVGHELEKPTYSAYYGARWLTHHGLFITEAAPLEAQGLLGDMAGDALEGDRACDEGGPGRIPIIHTPIIFPGCHDGHIDP